MPAAMARSRAASQSVITSFAMYSNTPAALHNSMTANPSRSSFAFLSTSESPRSLSYRPREVTTARERLERANAYVKRVNASSAAREGIDKRGEEWKSVEDRVVRQLKTAY